MTKKPKRRHPQPALPRGPRIEEILKQISALQEEGKYEEILRLIEEAPLHLQRRPELALARGLAYLSLEDPASAREALEEVARRTEDFPIVHALLAVAYRLLDMPGHAIRSLRTALRFQEYLPPDVLQEVQELHEGLNRTIQDIAETELKRSPLETEEALYLVEEAEDAIDAEEFPTALQISRQLQRQAPDWWTPYALEMDALWFAKRWEEVIQTGMRVAEKFPNHPGILAPLVWAAFFTNRRDLAERYAEPMKNRRYEMAGMLDKAVLALGLLEDDAALFRLYELNRHLLEDCTRATLMILAAAAANLQRMGVAQRIWRFMEDREGLDLFLTWDPPQRRAIYLRKPAPGRNSRYSTVLVAPLIPLRTLKDFYQTFQMAEEAADPISLERARKQVRRLAQQEPLLLPFLTHLFLEDEDYLFWAELLLWMETPEAEELLFRIARSPYGLMTERLSIFFLLAQYGKVSPGQPVEVWDENRKEWRTLPVPYWEIVPPPPEKKVLFQELLSAVSDLIAQKEWAKALAKLEEARAANPTAPEVYLFLGDIHAVQGHFLTAMEYFQKGLELAPQNVLARCSIAHLYLMEGNPVAARRALEPLLGVNRMTPREFFRWVQVMAFLHFTENDFGLARFYVERGLEINPDDSFLKDLRFQMDIKQGMGWGRYVRETQERAARKRRRPIQADASLTECLSRLSRESLQATVRVMPSWIPSGLKKSALIQRLTEVLTDPQWLEEIVEDLTSLERSALRDVLQAGGVMKWETFTERYGDDLEESPYWQYHDPQTLMGRLRVRGLLSDGTVEGEYVVLVPQELRELLPPLLEKAK